MNYSIQLNPLFLASVSLFFYTDILSAGTGGISAQDFKTYETVIYAETYECKNEVYCKVSKAEEWVEARSADPSVMIDSKIAEDYWRLRYDSNRHEKALYGYDKKEPTESQLEEAKKRDLARVSEVKASLFAELERVGLSFDSKKESIFFYDRGEAKMRVLESLKGELKKDDVIEVVWDCVVWRVSCPPLIPHKGKLGWVFEAKVKSDTKVFLDHGFFDLERAQKAKNEYLQLNKKP